MFAKMWSVLQKAFSKKEVKKRAQVIENALYGKLSKEDYEGLHAVASLITALCNNKCPAVSDAGLFIFYKIKNDEGELQVFHKRLTIDERNLINRKPTLLQDPYKLLENIEKGVAIQRSEAEKMLEKAKEIRGSRE